MYRICKCIQCFYYLMYRFIYQAEEILPLLWCRSAVKNLFYYQAEVALNISYLNTVVICVILPSGLSIKLTLFHDGTT